jgi:hypothetical protein
VAVSGWRVVTAHVITTLVTVAAFFALLWITVFFLDVAPDRAFVLSLMTFILVGLGLMFTRSTFFKDDEK